eukprot:4616395-Prymnesium_polylepis.2
MMRRVRRVHRQAVGGDLLCVRRSERGALCVFARAVRGVCACCGLAGANIGSGEIMVEAWPAKLGVRRRPAARGRAARCGRAGFCGGSLWARGETRRAIMRRMRKVRVLSLIHI